ncbi:MAG: hypothetical protein HY738_21970 [Bacteroidia bacterium]|nr:hypothetical protein [Bacteroidia bacterium]
MKVITSFIVFCIIFIHLHAQTVIEMMHPEDANLTLLVVDDTSKADIVVYRTIDKKEYQAWDCMWRFKKGGFANFTVYLTKNEDDSLLYDNDENIKRIIHGKVYFTNDINARGYRNKDFRLEGVLRKVDND